MKGLQNIENIYFLGIGGIGMSALARYFKFTGRNVAGYDRTPTPLTAQLEAEGIAIHYVDSVELIPPAFKSPGNTLIVLTPAVPKDHSEYNFLKNNQYPIFKRSEILGMLTRGHKTVAVAGTHGKTTVSTMIACIMAQSQHGCSAFLGGISKNFNSNLVIQEKSDWIVTEADEFDRSFLQLNPYAAVVTAMDPDHLDIYGNVETMNEAFNRFISQIEPSGFLLIKEGLQKKIPAKPANTFTYSLNGNSDFYAENIKLKNRSYHFDLIGPGTRINDLSVEHPGLVNVENAVAASAMNVLLKTGEEVIRKALGGFTGIQRRFDVQIKAPNLVYIDDYAHHPGEIEATLKSVRELYPEFKITGIFQPHLYTRTRDLAEGFAESLGLLDRLILLDIYPARELPIEGVSSEIIFNRVQVNDKILCTKQELIGIIGNLEIEVLITLGAGDIDKLVKPIRELLQKRVK